MNELIRVDNVSFQYDKGNDWALKDISLSISKGEWVAIVGHNGSGKSTLARLLNGMLIPQQGKVSVDNYETDSKDDIWEIRRRVGIVFQNPDNQFVATTVRDDIAFGLENIGIDRNEMKRRISESIQKVRMEQYIDAEPHRLSGGQKQRVAIAGIVAIKPLIIVLDEATSMLDPMGERDVLTTIRQLNKEEGITILSITHNLDEALLSDRVIVLNEGVIAKEGTPKEVFQAGEELVNLGLDLPFSIQLRNRLVNLGLPLSTDILTEEDLVNELWTLKLKA